MAFSSAMETLTTMTDARKRRSEWQCGSCGSSNVRYVTMKAYLDPGRPPDVEIYCLDCKQTSIGFSVPNELLTDIKRDLKQAGVRLPKNASVKTIIETLFERAKRLVGEEEDKNRRSS
jgi:hypothetical protein